MNNRWRQISKFIEDKHERWEYQYNNKSKPQKCPCCGNKLRIASWSDEQSCVETIEQCRYCGYEDHWSYGQNQLTVGKWREYYQHSTPHEQVEQIEKEFRRQIRLYRMRIKEYNRKWYRRKKSA